MELEYTKSILLDMFYGHRYCKSCGEDIRTLGEVLGNYHESVCTNKVLGYDVREEEFEPSSRIWFFKQGR